MQVLHSIIIELKAGRNVVWWPAVLDTEALNTTYSIPPDFHSDTYNDVSSNLCVPVLELIDGELVSPSINSIKYNNVSFYYADILSKLTGESLTSHAITFINSITVTLGIDVINIKESLAVSNEYGLVRHLENCVNYTEYIIQPNSDLIKEITDKHRMALRVDNKYTFACSEYPFFPISDKLYIRSCNTKYIDDLIEEQYSSSRIFGNSLGIIEVPASWRNVQQTMNGGVIDLRDGIGNPLRSLPIISDEKTIDYELKPQGITNAWKTVTLDGQTITTNLPTYSGFRMNTLPAYEIAAGSFKGTITDSTITMPNADAAITPTSSANNITGTFTRSENDTLSQTINTPDRTITLPTPPDYKVESQRSKPVSVDVSNVQMILNTSGETSIAERIIYQIDIKPISYNINRLLTVPAESSIYIYVTGNNHRYPLWRSNHALTVLQID